MNAAPSQRQVTIGVILAVAATIIWAGNFIIARGISQQVYPFTLAFYRWLIATVVILPFAYKRMQQELPLFKKNFAYFLVTAITGITLFNSFVYIAGHYSTAINLALIGTTASPVFIIVIAKMFLKEKIGWQRSLGLLLCISGIIYLICRGSIENLKAFHFTVGDLWVLLAALMFAIYSILVRKKPESMSAIGFLGFTFALGTVMITPFYITEQLSYPLLALNTNIIYSVLYLGVGASVISFLFWNLAIAKIGATRTALFGNLIPVFSTIEAALLLHEQITTFHVTSFILVASGLLLANMSSKKA